MQAQQMVMNQTTEWLTWFAQNPEIALGAAVTLGYVVLHLIKVYRQAAMLMSESIEVREPKRSDEDKPLKRSVRYRIRKVKDPITKFMFKRLAKWAEKRVS